MRVCGQEPVADSNLALIESQRQESAFDFQKSPRVCCAFVGSAALFFAVAALTSYVPARRAVRVDHWRLCAKNSGYSLFVSEGIRSSSDRCDRRAPLLGAEGIENARNCSCIVWHQRCDVEFALGGVSMQSLFYDLRYALRQLRKTPGVGRWPF